jgi:Flp pilus assembly protein protease CpaA
METKLILALPILIWMAAQDLKRRKINNVSWVALVLLGVISFGYEIFQTPSKGLAAMFIVSLLGSMVISFFFYSLEWWGGGDALVLIGISTVTYNILPFPFFIPILLFATFLGLSWALLQRRIENEVDVAFAVHLFLSFVVCTSLFQ